MKIRFTKDEEIKKEILKALKENDYYCPCHLEKLPETKCMCQEFRNQNSGTCHCGLYVKE